MMASLLEAKLRPPILAVLQLLRHASASQEYFPNIDLEARTTVGEIGKSGTRTVAR